MSKFENKSRKCYEDMVAFTAANVLNVKKKEFLNVVKKASSAEELYNYVSKKVDINGLWGDNVKTLQLYNVLKKRVSRETYKHLLGEATEGSSLRVVPKELVNYLYYFNNVKRYWLPELDKDTDVVVDLSTLENLFEEGNAVVIEVTILGKPEVLLCEKLCDSICIDNVQFTYKVTWYDSGKSRSGIETSVVAACAYVSTDEGIVVTVSDTVGSKTNLQGTSMLLDGCSRYCLRHNATDNKTKLISGFVNEAVHLASYVGYCIKYKDTLTRKNGAASKKYEVAKVHVAKPEVCDDRVIPLHVYVKEYSYIGKQEHKGGHHKGPIEHDRRGYYRKSRGVGDYDYVNGEFVYVGKRQGKYSFVKACHISGGKGNVVYKV